VPSGPVTERRVGVESKERDGWNLMGVFPMLDVCARVIGEEEKERKATVSLRASMGWFVGGLEGSARARVADHGINSSLSTVTSSTATAQT